jgi:hypothetical protein
MKSATTLCALCEKMSVDCFGLSAVPQCAVPLPAALPLFATGLGGLGLLGWRRKRKASAGMT